MNEPFLQGSQIEIEPLTRQFDIDFNYTLSKLVDTVLMLFVPLLELIERYNPLFVGVQDFLAGG
ncbi:MAG: hypothetical protein KGL04_05035 [Elusimicrobia bacterium]|nr:hypothetical protein [Elusimicrobiota bacterium]